LVAARSLFVVISAIVNSNDPFLLLLVQSSVEEESSKVDSPPFEPLEVAEFIEERLFESPISAFFGKDPQDAPNLETLVSSPLGSVPYLHPKSLVGTLQTFQSESAHILDLLPEHFPRLFSISSNHLVFASSRDTHGGTSSCFFLSAFPYQHV